MDEVTELAIERFLYAKQCATFAAIAKMGGAVNVGAMGPAAAAEARRDAGRYWNDEGDADATETAAVYRALLVSQTPGLRSMMRGDGTLGPLIESTIRLFVEIGREENSRRSWAARREEIFLNVRTALAVMSERRISSFEGLFDDQPALDEYVRRVTDPPGFAVSHQLLARIQIRQILVGLYLQETIARWDGSDREIGIGTNDAWPDAIRLGPTRPIAELACANMAALSRSIILATVARIWDEDEAKKIEPLLDLPAYINRNPLYH